MEAFDKGLDKVVTALAYLASAFIPCIFTMIVIDVSIRTIGITPPFHHVFRAATKPWCSALLPL